MIDEAILRQLAAHARSLAPDAGAGFALENLARAEAGRPGGQWRIAGVDEAGRGPLAGPVVAAAVILDPHHHPPGLADSKKLGEKKRQMLFDLILQQASVAWAAVSSAHIDRINILQATLLAMARAVGGLVERPDLVLIDGRDVPQPLKGQGAAIVKGDSLSLSIAAASIIAKVMRDRMMERYDGFYPQYGFAGHKGYGTKAHRAAIEACGPSPIHRMSFSPLRQDRLDQTSLPHSQRIS